MQTPPMVQYMLQLHGARSRDAARKMLQLNGPPGEGGICPLPARAALNRSKALPMPSRMITSAASDILGGCKLGPAARARGAGLRFEARSGQRIESAPKLPPPRQPSLSQFMGHRRGALCRERL